MEIGLTKKGMVSILSVRGRIRLQNWRVLDKHLDNLYTKGCRWLVLDLSEVSLICSTGVGSLLSNIGKFQSDQGGLLVVCTGAYMQEIFTTFGLASVRNVSFFTDWESLENRLRSQGLAVA